MVKADDGEPKVTHTSELVERHRITISVGATGDNVAVARLHAEAYARARGFELPADKIGVVTTRGRAPGDEEFIGVSFEVHVGHGDIAADQRVPGVLDRWRWSAAACDWWRDILNRADGREGKLLSLMDHSGKRRIGRITGMRPIEGDPGGVSIEGQFLDTSASFYGFGDTNRPVGAHPGWSDPAAYPSHPIVPIPPAADQRPPWAQRGDPDFTDSAD